jgi:hypothetical protein
MFIELYVPNILPTILYVLLSEPQPFVRNTNFWKELNFVCEWQQGCTQRGGLGGSNTPEIILKFWQIRVEFPVPWKIHPKNLLRIRVSPICKLGGTPD